MDSISQSPADTRLIAADILHTIVPTKAATVLALSGDLGAGKTAFAQAVGQIVGVTEEMQSPTFVIEKIYDIDWKGFKRLIHVDAYRLESADELLRLGWNEILTDPAHFIIIEWPEKVADLIPASAERISLTVVDEHSRHIRHATS